MFSEPYFALNFAQLRELAVGIENSRALWREPPERSRSNWLQPARIPGYAAGMNIRQFGSRHGHDSGPYAPRPEPGIKLTPSGDSFELPATI